ncbi:hypothetical protein P5W04_10340 [Mycobacteroides abscessus subsp. abscessus]|uniref:hypothetical protein n=1 Tax=Mycobacteroides abscessus TaxID=36809 RepID=UPI000E688DFC|nr:hypothetical protein [Mycobacteroides abscessus]MBN7484545.1 hypothetical protein [Mycobacteroides abscessus subsp. abscessus]MDO3240513.1 hypothetical protein [Mycobacteroides abscessus subsp. abscessus]RIT75008.1 hypothetical protein D2E77_01615 [Mycobacteroides abscessus]
MTENHTKRRTSGTVERIAHAIITRRGGYTPIERPHVLVNVCVDCIDNPTITGIALMGPDDLYRHVSETDPRTALLIEQGKVSPPTRDAGEQFGDYVVRCDPQVPVAYVTASGSVWEDADGELDLDREATLDAFTRHHVTHMRGMGHVHVGEHLVTRYWDLPSDRTPTVPEQRTQVDRQRIYDIVREASTAAELLRGVPYSKQTDFDLLITDADCGQPLLVLEETEGRPKFDIALSATQALARQTHSSILYAHVRVKLEDNGVYSRTYHLRMVYPDHLSMTRVCADEDELVSVINTSIETQTVPDGLHPR